MEQKERVIAVEVKNPQQKGGSAADLLDKGKLHYLINARVDTMGGKSGKITTIPIYLFGRFKIEEIMQPYVSEADLEAEALLTEIKKMNSFN